MDRRGSLKVLLCCLPLLAWAAPAHAYLDPNLGGALFQWCLPLLLAIVAFWNYLRRLAADTARRLFAWLRGLFGA